MRRIDKLNPPSTIGIIGGGQLGRMMSADAKRMGYNVIVLDPKPNSPTGQVCDEQIQARFDDINGMRELAKKSDVLTYEFEHINVDLLKILEDEGHKLYPSSQTLRIIQNKFVQKTMLKEIDVKVADFYKIESLDELKNVFEKLGGKLILKTCTDGYDGKGNIVIKDISKLEEAYEKFSGFQIMAEELIDFKKEVSIIVARNHDGIALYPVAENVHENSILIKSYVPANVTEKVSDSIFKVSEKVIDAFDDYGIFCIEYFVDQNDNVLVNEIAPRPHNSGHYTIEGCVSSQYEQIIRIVTGMPLGSPKLRCPSVMYNILGDETVTGSYRVEGGEVLLGIEDCHLHLYGKPETADQKKIGHITALGETVLEADKKAMEARKALKFKSL